MPLASHEPLSLPTDVFCGIWCASSSSAFMSLCSRDAQALEFQAQQRLFALQQEELAAAGSSALQDAAAAQASMLAAQLQRKTAEWQAEDEARALRLQHEQARKARLTAAAEKEAALQAAKGVLLAQELQTQEELAKVGQHAMAAMH